MKNKILAGIAVVWGISLVGRWLSPVSAGGGGSDLIGADLGAVFGALLIIAGLYYFSLK
jgi:hypothetical protein